MHSLTSNMIATPAVTLPTMVFDTLVAIGLTRSEFRGKVLVMNLMILPVMVSVMIIGAVSHLLFVPFRFGSSYLSLIVVHAIFDVSFVTITVFTTLQESNYSLVCAVASLDAPPLTTLFWVTLPLIAPGVVSDALFAFAASSDEVVVTLLLAGPEQAIPPWQMFSGIRGNLSLAIAIAMTLLIGSPILLLLTPG